MKKYTLKDVWFDENNYGVSASVIKDEVWVPVRLVGSKFDLPGKGFHTIEAENIWLDKRDANKLVYRVKGEYTVKFQEPTGANDELIEVSE